MGIKLVSTFIDAATGKMVVHVSERANFRRHEPSYIASTAYALIQRGECEKAINLIEEALPRHRKDARLHSQLAGTYIEMAHQLLQPPVAWSSTADYMRARAAQLFRTAADLKPGDSGFAIGAGRVYEALGDHLEAFNFYRRAVKAQSLKARSWIALGDFFMRQGVQGQAQMCFRNAVRVEGTDDIVQTRMREHGIEPMYWGPITYKPLGYTFPKAI